MAQKGKNKSDHLGPWQKVKQSIENINVDSLKEEIFSFAQRLQKMTPQSWDVSETKEHLKSIEKRYHHLNQAMVKAQKQLERDFNKKMAQLKSSRKEATEIIKKLKLKVNHQKKEWDLLSAKIHEKVNEITRKISKEIKKSKTSREESKSAETDRGKTKERSSGSSKKATSKKKATSSKKVASLKSMSSSLERKKVVSPRQTTETSRPRRARKKTSKDSRKLKI